MSYVRIIESKYDVIYKPQRDCAWNGGIGAYFWAREEYDACVAWSEAINKAFDEGLINENEYVTLRHDFTSGTAMEITNIGR